MKPYTVIMIACGSLASSLPGLATQLPHEATPYIVAAAAVCGLVATVLGAITGSATQAHVDSAVAKAVGNSEVQ